MPLDEARLREYADALYDRCVEKPCNDKAHDERWCRTCEDMRDAYEIAADEALVMARALLREVIDECAEQVDLTYDKRVGTNIGTAALTVEIRRAIRERFGWLLGEGR